MSLRIATSIATAALVLGGASAAAFGHAPPRGTALWWIPAQDGAPGGVAGERLVIRTPRGFLFQAASANDLRLLCNDAIGVQDGEEASFAIADGGALLITTFARGLLRGNTDACRWDQVGTIVTTPAFDVATAVVPGGSGEAPAQFVIGGSPNQGDHFWGGRADGTWSALANTDMPYTRVRIAPSDPSRIYLTGMALDASGMAVHRLGISADAGTTVVEQLIPLGPTDLQARVLGVNSVRPDQLYLRVESNSFELSERLLVSEDKGRSFTAAATLHEIQGFAQSVDGRDVWVGGTEGIRRSTDGGRTFSGPINATLTKITCLAFHQNRLYACGVLDNQLVVAVSDDAGDSFRKVFSFDQVTQPVDCPQLDPATSPAAVCAGSLEHWRSEFGTLTPPPMAGTGGAGAVPSAPPPGGCSVGGSEQGPGDAASLSMFLLAFAVWRRKRSPSATAEHEIHEAL